MALLYPKVVIDGCEESGALKMIRTIYLDQKIGLIVENNLSETCSNKYFLDILLKSQNF